MELIKCDDSHREAVTELYHRSIEYLESTVNYPKWNPGHPSDKGVRKAIENGTQYVCLDNGEAVGALVLSEDPEGCYEAGEWSIDLERGEFLIIHVLAVDPDKGQRGIGGFMVERCIDIARRGGYKAIRLDVVPGNIPAEKLYAKYGFTYAGRKDLLKNIDFIPLFDLYELVL